MDYLDSFNDTVNSAFSFLDDPVINNVVRLSLVLYGGLAAPKLPLKWGPIFSKTWFRIAVMAAILWTANRDPVLSILVAVVYFISMTYFYKNGIQSIASTGVVSPEVKVIISGSAVAKPPTVVAGAQLMQTAVNPTNPTINAPKAVISTGGSTGASATIGTNPSNTPASATTMMAKTAPGKVPESFTPDDIMNLAVAPN